MVAKACSDEQFIQLFETLGPAQTAKFLNITERNVFRRRKTLESYGTHLTTPRKQDQAHSPRVELTIKNGCVIVGSDFHIWPGPASTCLRAFKKLCKDLKPAAVILNGDVLDFPQISRHPPIGWEGFPELVEEIEAAQDHLTDIVQVLPRSCHKAWTLGNHDARYNTRLATVAREYRGLNGTSLSDFFPVWQKAWSVWINDDVVIKHRFKGGAHATYNNTLHAGKTIITGHLHAQRVTAFTDYTGTRYGVDSGCVADPNHKAFGYIEDNPKNWISGFVVLNFIAGKLLYPELVSHWPHAKDTVQFRGKLLKV